MLDAVTRKVRAGAVRAGEIVPWRSVSLAEPPVDSGWEPVPGDYGFPVVGRGLSIPDDVIDLARQRYERYGSVSWTGMLGIKAVLVVGPDAVEQVVNNQERAFANGPGWKYFIGPFFNRGIMLLDFEEHLHHKRIMQQGFTRDMLRRYSVRLDAGISAAVSNWRPGPGLLLFDAVKQLLLDLANDVLVGTELGPQADRVNAAFIDTVKAGLSMVRHDVPGGGWHRGLQGRKLLEKYFRELLPAKRDSDADDLFSVLCRSETEDGARFDDDDIVNHMIFVLMAAHDTTTITASTMAYHLGKHPEWQERLRDEVREFGKESIGYDDLERLPLLDRVFRESLRINPPVAVMMREAVKDTAILNRYVPAGTKIMVPIIATHRLQGFWTDPDTFDPDRFAPHRREDRRHPFLWSPFGGGVHKCIGQYFGGMQAKTIVYHLLRTHRWHLPADYEPPMDFATGMYPGDGLPVELELLDGR